MLSGASDPVAMAAALKEYGPAAGAKQMLEWEKAAAEEAIASGVYITWRTEDGSDCTRVGAHSKCFCNHYYGEHKQGLMKSQCLSEGCKCGRFEFVPVRPEECGMWWLPRRPDFNVHTWEPKCSCKHGPSKHSCKFSKKCRMRGCGCSSFHSDFACVVCDKKWESHETVWETRDEREADGKPVGADWLPLAEVPEMQQMVFMDRGVRKPGGAMRPRRGRGGASSGRGGRAGGGAVSDRARVTYDADADDASGAASGSGSGAGTGYSAGAGAGVAAAGGDFAGGASGPTDSAARYAHGARSGGGGRITINKSTLPSAGNPMSKGGW